MNRVFIVYGSEQLGMGLGLKRLSIGMMAIFMISVIGLIGFFPQNSYAFSGTISDKTSCEGLGFGTWTGPDTGGPGTCTTLVDETVNPTESLIVDNGVTLVVTTTIHTTFGGFPAGLLKVNSGGIITINPGATINNEGGIVVFAGGTMDNQGTINNSLGPGGAGSIDSVGTFTNSGIININQGSSTIFNDGASSSTTNSGTITIFASDMTIEGFAGTSLTNTGTINNNGGQITNYGTIDNYGGTSTINNNLNFNNQGTINNGDGGTNNGHITNVGSFGNIGSIKNTSTGIINNSGDFSNDSSEGGPGSIVNDGVFSNNGIIDNSGSNIVNNNLIENSGPSATINNNYGSLITNNSPNGEILLDSNGGNLNNVGTITNNGPSGRIVIDNGAFLNNQVGTTAGIIDNFGSIAIIGTLNNDGTINNNSGGIINNLDHGTIINNGGLITNKGTINNDAGGTIDNNNGDTLDNYGTIENNGTITNEDVINNYGTMDNKSGGIIDNNLGSTINNKSPGSCECSGGTITNDGTIKNAGTTRNENIIKNDNLATIINENASDCACDGSGTITNFGTITNYSGGTITNDSLITNNDIIDNLCGGIINGNGGSVSGTPITNEPCIHHTKIILNPIVSPFAGNKFSVNGELVDLDNGNVGVPNEPITFTFSPSVGVPSTTSSGITFTDSSPNLSVSSCSGCPGTPNVMRLHTGATISIPSTPPYVELFGADMGGATFTIQVTYGDSSTGTFTTPSIPANTVVALGLTSPGNVGISSIQITGVSSGLAGISKVKTFDRILGQVLETTFPASIPAVTTMSFNQGEFFSVGTTSTTPATGLTVTASFAGDANYLPSTSTTQTFNTYFSTTAGVAGIGGAETSTPDAGRLIPAKTCDSMGVDLDNLCKSWKGTGATNGIPYQYNTYFGTPGTAYYKLPASCTVGKQCVLVEADSMTGFAPNSAALADVTTAFANNHVSLFIQPSSTGTLNTLDENNLQLANNMAVWTDADNIFTNDFDSIKASHFGTAAERPVLSTTQSATILSTPTPTSSSQTLEISGITIVTRNTGAPGGVTEGTLTVKVKLPMTSATTLTTGTITQPIPQNSKLIFGPISTAVNSKATFKILTITIPFDTTGTILTAASFGSIDVPLNLAGGTPPVPLVPDSTTVPLTPIVTTNLLDAKAQAYRYLLFVSSIGGPNPPGPSGITSNAPGNKAIVALGASIFPTTPTEQQQAGTIMHELGHLLGLGHGGPTSAADSTINCKPNYPSVMSYSRQLPTYLGTSDWKLDYSHGVLPDLDETQLTDVMGTPQVTSGTVTPMIVWGTPGSTIVHPATGTTTYNKQTSVTSAPPDIDWLGNGVTAGNIVAPISGFGTSGCTETVAGSQFTGKYHDYNDWNNLNFNFQTGSGASALSGASDAALFTFGDDQIVEEPHSDYNGPILQAQTASSSVYPGPFFDGSESYVKLDGSSVFKGGSTVELEFQLFVSGTKVKLVDWPTTSTNFVGNVGPYIFAKVTTNDPSSPLNGMIIAAQGKFKLDSDPSLFKHYETNWKTPTVTKTTKVYISLFVQPPALTTTPPALSSVLLSTPLKDNHGNVVSEIITLKP